MFQLTREETDVDDALANRHQWPIQYTAVLSADGTTPAKIFVMHAVADPAEDGVFADSFSCVSNAVQYTDLPEDAAEAGSPFYRVNTFTKLCRSPEAATEFIEKIEAAVQELVNNLDAATNLAVTDVTTITPDA